jgi:hypothetical protein
MLYGYLLEKKQEEEIFGHGKKIINKCPFLDAEKIGLIIMTVVIEESLIIIKVDVCFGSLSVAYSICIISGFVMKCL